MRGGSSIFEPSTGPRRPVPKGLGENAFLRVYGPSEPITRFPLFPGLLVSNVTFGLVQKALRLLQSKAYGGHIGNPVL